MRGGFESQKVAACIVTATGQIVDVQRLDENGVMRDIPQEEIDQRVIKQRFDAFMDARVTRLIDNLMDMD